MQLLGSEQREALLQIEAHLVAEYAPGTGTGAITLVGAVVQNVLHEIEILAHAGILPDPPADVKVGVLYPFRAWVGRVPPSVGKTVQAAHPGIALALIPEVELGIWMK